MKTKRKKEKKKEGFPPYQRKKKKKSLSHSERWGMPREGRKRNSYKSLSRRFFNIRPPKGPGAPRKGRKKKDVHHRSRGERKGRTDCNYGSCGEKV